MKEIKDRVNYINMALHGHVRDAQQRGGRRRLVQVRFALQVELDLLLHLVSQDYSLGRLSVEVLGLVNVGR